MTKGSSILKKIGLVLIYTVPVTVVGLILITLMGAIDVAVSRLQAVGWWTIFVIGFLVSFLYIAYEPRFKRWRERRKIVNALTLYLGEQYIKEGHKQPADEDLKLVHKMFLERVKIWAWSNPELWSKNFSDEKYPKYLFGIVDNFIEAHKDTIWEKTKKDK